MTKDNKTFHKRLRAIIDNDRAHGKHIKNIAAAIGVTANSLSAYAYGDAMPNAYNLARIADYYGVSMDYLMGRTVMGRTEEMKSSFVANNYDSFHERLRNIIDKQRLKGKSVRIIANEIGIIQNSLRSYTYGVSFPSASSLAMIADCYGVSMDYLMGRIAVTEKERIVS